MAFGSAPRFPEEKSKGDSQRTPAKTYAETLKYSPLSSSAIPYVNAPIGGNSGTPHYLSFSSGNYPGLRPNLSSSITAGYPIGVNSTLTPAGYPSLSSKANRTDPKEAEAKAPFQNETSAKSSELKEVSLGKNASPPFADTSPHINSQDGKFNPEGQDGKSIPITSSSSPHLPSTVIPNKEDDVPKADQKNTINVISVPSCTERNESLPNPTNPTDDQRNDSDVIKTELEDQSKVDTDEHLKKDRNENFNTHPHSIHNLDSKFPAPPANKPSTVPTIPRLH